MTSSDHFWIKLMIRMHYSLNNTPYTVVCEDRHFTLMWSTYKIVPDSPVLYPISLLLLKIKMFLIIT